MSKKHVLDFGSWLAENKRTPMGARLNEAEGEEKTESGEIDSEKVQAEKLELLKKYSTKEKEIEDILMETAYNLLFKTLVVQAKEKDIKLKQNLNDGRYSYAWKVDGDDFGRVAFSEGTVEIKYGEDSKSASIYVYGYRSDTGYDGAYRGTSKNMKKPNIVTNLGYYEDLLSADANSLKGKAKEAFGKLYKIPTV